MRAVASTSSSTAISTVMPFSTGMTSAPRTSLRFVTMPSASTKPMPKSARFAGLAIITV